MDKLLGIINSILENKGEDTISQLSDEMSLRNDFGFDSLDLAELTVKIEKEYGIDVFADGIVENIKEIKVKLKL